MLIIANWKLNKTTSEAQKWLSEFTGSPDIETVVASSFPYISVIKEHNDLIPAAQDVSKFKHGSAHTGEVSAKQLADLGVKYVLVGHSERRRDFGETEADVNEKIARCLENDLVPIVCVSNVNQVETLHATSLQAEPLLIAYEPLEAIGSGKPEDPAEAQKMAIAIRDILGENTQVLYGGSVDSTNVTNYTSLDEIDGVLVGGASLEAKEFSRLVCSVGKS